MRRRRRRRKEAALDPSIKKWINQFLRVTNWPHQPGPGLECIVELRALKEKRDLWPCARCRSRRIWWPGDGSEQTGTTKNEEWATERGRRRSLFSSAIGRLLHGTSSRNVPIPTFTEGDGCVTWHVHPSFNYSPLVFFNYGAFWMYVV